MSKDNTTILNILLALVVISIALFSAEMALRLFYPESAIHYVWQPGMHKIFHPSSAVMEGVSGPANFVVNSNGIRGDEFQPDDEYRILAIGGSTTESAYLDQPEMWTSVLESGLENQKRNY